MQINCFQLWVKIKMLCSNSLLHVLKNALCCSKYVLDEKCEEFFIKDI